VPQVDESDVLRVVHREFSAENSDRVMHLLSGYTSDNPHRVRLAILKLAKGSIESIADLVRQAKSDYRDVLVAAEYVHYWQLGLDATDEQKSQAIEQDWAQYQEWLRR
jgi:hypothetical protein